MDATGQFQEQMPARLGRYRVTSRIGSSVAGAVYRAWDDELRRDVAIKVPSRDWLKFPSQVEEYLARARQVSRLDHPGIVPLFDVGRSDDGDCYLVSRFVSGGDLAGWVGRSPPAPARALDLVIRLAEALHFAHRSGVVHGNVKPSNVLFDDQDRPSLADFGLLLDRAERFSESSPAGGAAYHCPEQLRGEQHRIDARADIYSLGAVLYELLSGEWPLCRLPLAEAVGQAMHYEPPFLSDVAPGIPVELARICHKALSRRIADRYTTIVDFAEDLQACALLLPSPGTPTESIATVLAGDPSGSIARTAAGAGGTSMAAASTGDGETHIVPKGLRSFDQEDADFFLELLPGPRGRDRLPESLRFWKSQIEESDPEKTFSVGLIYGPSGCGKSSLVKAGLLPRLDVGIIPIYLEATTERTEARLLAQLRRRVPSLAPQLDLTDSIAELRRGRCLPRDRKVLLVLDQFEQWLHANRDNERPEILTALRQCDGRRVQGLVMVRDDFWMAVTRFMHDLDIKLVEGHNSAAVDLFGMSHARKVLIAFGRAYGVLSGADSTFTPEETEFLDRAIEGLAHDGKVVSVQLALFADMIKNKPWTPATLAEVGGAEGIGLAFLEETFSVAHAPPEHRRHQRAARAVLKLLLPEQGTDIKGQMHSRAQLLAGSGYEDRPQEFDELLQILDQELRLVTPADPEGVEGNLDSGIRISDIQNAFYQLTHDFLVPSVRSWLVRKQQETRRGQAELLLEERAATWSARSDRRYLPSLWQTLRIRLFTRPRDWSAAQRAMMRSAVKIHALRAVAAATLLLILGWGGVETFRAVKAQTLRDRLLYASTAEVAGVIREMAPLRWWVNRSLRATLAAAAPKSREEWRARLGLLPDDPGQVEPLFERCFDVDDEAFPLLRDALSGDGQGLTERLWTTLEDSAAGGERQLRSAMLLAGFVPPQKGETGLRWERNASSIASLFHSATVKDPARFKPLVAALAPIGDMLVDPLSERARDTQLAESDRMIATNLMAEYAANRPDILTGVLLEGGSPSRLGPIIDKLQLLASRQIPLLELEATRRPEDLQVKWKDDPLKTDSVPAAATVGILDGAAGMLADRFAFCQTLPLTDFQKLAEGLRAAGYRPIRFRPYHAGDLVRVAALWTRDDREWQIDEGLSEGEMQKLIAGPRMNSDLLVDLAAYETPAGEVHHTALWSKRRPGDPEARAYIGPSTDRWNQARSAGQNEGFGVVSLDFRSQLPDSYSVSAVLWKGSETSTLELRGPRVLEGDLDGELASRAITAIDVAAAPYQTRAEARLGWHQADIAVNENMNRTSPEKLVNWQYAGHRRFLVGQYEQAIRDLSHFIDNGGEKESNPWLLRACHEYRAYAAARLRQEEEAARWLEEANAAHGNDAFGNKFRATMLELFAGDLRDQPEEFEKYSAEQSATGWAQRATAQVDAVAAGIARQADPARAAAYTDRAIAQLRQAIRNGETNSIWWYLTDIFFEPIVDDPRMIDLQVEAEVDNIPALKFALRGDAELARKELVDLLQKSNDQAANPRTEFLVEVLLGNEDRAERRLEAMLTNAESIEYWGMAGGYSVASHLLATKNPDRAQWYADRAFELLNKRIAIPWSGSVAAAFRRELLTHWLFAPLRSNPRMSDILAGLDRQYSVISAENTDIESRVLRGLEPAEHRERCRELAAQGFRPVALDACLPAGSKVPGTASVWQRPAVGERQRDQFARRQATAAVALFRLGKPDHVWNLLKSDPDSRLRTWVMNLLAPAGTNPQSLAKRLDQETDVAVRRELVIALGKASLDRLSLADRDSLVERLLTLYHSDPDPGMHSAAEWVLRKWDQKEKLAAAEEELASVKPGASNGWFVNGHGDVMVTVPGPVEFGMGTPVGEPERGTNETRHRRRILRSFAVATKEVTVRQWEQFLKANPRIKYQPNLTTSPEPDCPVGMVNWYMIAAYCRWLSEQESFQEDEIGLPPLEQIRPGMQLKPYFLARSGYRLPTEAEWEYACRAGTGARWYHGESVELLLQYAWFKDNAAGRSWPVGTLPPNAWGLFDIEGNIQELCHQHLAYPKTSDNELRDDACATQRMSQHLSLRSGSFPFPRNETRSGRRYDLGDWAYNNSAGHIGFRIVRTLLPPELRQARRHRGTAADLRMQGESGEADRVASQAQAAYERLLAAHPENPDLAWELADFLLESAGTDWQILEPAEVTSRDGTTLAILPNGMVLASGKSPDNDLYTLRFETKMPAITALRLEVMPDPSLPGNGPGRSTADPGGNFHLSEVRVEAAPQSSADQRTTIPFKRAIADFSQNGFAVANTIDDDAKTAWGIAFETGQPHWAIFEPAQPIGHARGSALFLRLEFDEPVWKNTTLGRFRISATMQREPARIDQWRSRLARASLNGWARLAATYALLEKPDAARAALDRAGKEPVGEFVDDLFLMALIYREIDQPEEARMWLERGVARSDKNSGDTNLRQLAGDSVLIALEQEPPDLPFLTRLESLLGRPGNQSTAPNTPHDMLLRRGRMCLERGDMNKAATEFVRALDLSPKKYFWSEARARTAFAISEFDDAFLRATELRPDADDLWVARARRHYLNNRWTAAAADFAHVIKSIPPGEEWFEYAALLLLAGEVDQYRAFSRAAVEQFRNSTDPLATYLLARAAILSDKPPADTGQILKWAEAAVARDSAAYKVHVLGMAHLRAGNYEEAVRRFQESRDAGFWSEVQNVQNVLGLAIAYAKVGKEAHAREFLDQAKKTIPATGLDVWPTDWLEIQIVRREAEALIPTEPQPPK